MKAIKIISGNTKQFCIDDKGKTYVFVKQQRKDGSAFYVWEPIYELRQEKYEKDTT